jgi:hypothetical protein
LPVRFGISGKTGILYTSFGVIDQYAPVIWRRWRVMTRTRTARGRIGGTLLALVALVWAGMIIGVSGLATPIKFTAPSLTLPHALEGGRVTFHLFSRVEWGLAIMLAFAGFAAGTSRML